MIHYIEVTPLLNQSKKRVILWQTRDANNLYKKVRLKLLQPHLLI